MAMDSQVRGLSGTVAEVDGSNNLKVVVAPASLAAAPFVTIGGEISSAAEAGGLVRKRAWFSAEGRQHVALDRPVFYLNFAGSATSANAIPQDVLKQTTTGPMTAVAGSTRSGFLVLNDSAVTTTVWGMQYQTYQTFPVYGGYGTIYEWEAQTINAVGAANKVIELGCGLTTDSKTAGLLDGFCFRWDSTAGGPFRGVISINGVETSMLLGTTPTDNVTHRFGVRLNQDGVYFFVDQVLVGVLAPPADQVGPSLQPNLPMLMRVFNIGTPSLPPQLKIAEMWVTQAGIDWNKPWPHIMSGMGQHASNVPFGTAIGETTNGGNATAVPAAAAGTNTAAMAGCATLGGIAQMNAQVASTAAAGDMVMFQYQVPAQTATQGSKRLVITGVRLSTVNLGAAVAGTPTVLVWGLAWGHTAASLATADAVTAKAPRHLKLGIQSAAIGAAIGQVYSPENLTMQFTTPISVNPGEYVALTCRFLVGTATASQVVCCVAGIEGYWE